MHHGSVIGGTGVNQSQQKYSEVCKAIDQPQVDRMLDSASFSLDALESTVQTLLGRLTAVTGDYPEQDRSPSASSDLVPVAARIQYLESRVRDVESRLSNALSNLQV